MLERIISNAYGDRDSFATYPPSQFEEPIGCLSTDKPPL